MPVRTTVVGSWWKHPDDEEALARIARAAQRSSTASASAPASCPIQEQRGLGLEEWTGGEYWTLNFIDHLQRYVEGIEVFAPGEDETFDYDGQEIENLVKAVASL